MPDPLASIPVPARQRYLDLVAVLRERADVQALYLTGSLQREDQTADAWSDIDLTLVTRDPAAYRESEAWLREVASIDFRVLYTPRHLRVLFHDGVLLELGVFDEVDVRQPHPLLGISAGRVILDRANLTDALERVAAQHSPFVWSAAQYAGKLAFLYSHLLLVHRRLARGEVFSAYQLYVRFADWVLKYVTASAEDLNPAFQDPMDPARRFERRYPALASLLPQLFPACEVQAVREALRLALNLLDEYGREVLASSGEVFPDALARAVRTRVELEGDRQGAPPFNSPS